MSQSLGADPEVIRYEHPLNERIRTMMRLEDLYRRALFFNAATAPADHHAALLALFEIADVSSRADLKTDILQELERQRQLLTPLKHNPAIEHEALDSLLAEVDKVSARLLAQSQVGAHLRETSWLMRSSATALPEACRIDCRRFLLAASRSVTRQHDWSGLRHCFRSMKACRSSCASCAKMARREGTPPFTVYSSSCLPPPKSRSCFDCPSPTTCRACPKSAPTSTR